MRKVKLVAFLLLAVLLAIVLVQNTEPAQMRFLWAAGEMPVAMLLAVTATGGFVLGILVALLVRGRRKRVAAGRR